MVGVVTAIALAFGAGGGAASTALLAQHASSSRLANVSTTTTLNPAVQLELHKLEASPQGRVVLLRAFQASFGKVGDVSDGSAETSSTVRLTADCAGISCGVSGTGGWHFWIIASYAAVLSAGTITAQYKCISALVTVLSPVGATGVCLSAAAILWELVNNWPRLTNHGVWMAIYWNHISDGRY
jgi:hypothetical protein